MSDCTCGTVSQTWRHHRRGCPVYDMNNGVNPSIAWVDEIQAEGLTTEQAEAIMKAASQMGVRFQGLKKAFQDFINAMTTAIKPLEEFVSLLEQEPGSKPKDRPAYESPYGPPNRRRKK